MPRRKVVKSKPKERAIHYDRLLEEAQNARDEGAFRTRYGAVWEVTRQYTKRYGKKRNITHYVVFQKVWALYESRCKKGVEYI